MIRRRHSEMSADHQQRDQRQDNAHPLLHVGRLIPDHRAQNDRRHDRQDAHNRGCGGSDPADHVDHQEKREKIRHAHDRPEQQGGDGQSGVRRATRPGRDELGEDQRRRGDVIHDADRNHILPLPLLHPFDAQHEGR